MESRGLLRRTSSISLRIAAEHSGGQRADSQELLTALNAASINENNSEFDNKVDEPSANGAPKIVDEQEFDTDVASESDDELGVEAESHGHGDADTAKEDNDEANPPLRISSRIKSMKRRGKIMLQRFKSEKFLYFANDCLAVRGEEKNFYLCRVLDDVPENSECFPIAWFDKVDPKEHIYKVSYDDFCYQSSVIERVKLDEIEEDKYKLGKKHLKQVKKLLKEALGDKSCDDHSEGSDEEGTAEVSSNEDDEERAPPKKRRKKEKKVKKDTKKQKKKPTKEQKPLKRRGLIPNLNIPLVEKDPIFEENGDVPIMPVKRGLRAVLLNDMKMLQDAIDDVDHVHTVFWNRSTDIKLGPIEYAILNDNVEALELLDTKKHPKKRNAGPPHNYLRQNNVSKKCDFYIFGHAVRKVDQSRGSKEGDKAFCADAWSGNESIDGEFCMKKGASTRIMDRFIKDKNEFFTVLAELWRAVRNGHRKLAAHFLSEGSKLHDITSVGFNFLHKEALVNNGEPLSKFQARSVTKKPIGNQNMMPIHCAAINPNPKYLQEMLSAVNDNLLADDHGRKLIHYAAACEGPGPLKLLIARGVDPNDVDRKGTSPLMIAAKLGRDENINVLLSMKTKNPIDMDDDSDEEDDEDKATPSEVARVNVNVKHRRKTMSPLHYAAKNGHESTVRLLINHGAVIDMKAGTRRDNATALVLAAQQGHLHVVKALIELGASPDIRVQRKKTPLMFAARNGHYKVMAYLLRIGVNPDSVDTSLNTPIHYAAAYGWYPCVQLLLDAGANPNVGNMWKTTPLSIALVKNHMPCVNLLLDVVKDVSFPDDQGATILMKQLLENYEEASIEKIKFLVEQKGADPNNEDMDKNTALHYLASNSVYKSNWQYQCNRIEAQFDKQRSEICNKICLVLLNAGANVDIVNKNGQTPIMIAILQNNFPLVELLMQHKANLNIGVDIKSKETALHLLLSKTKFVDLLELYNDFSEYAENPADLSSEVINKLYKLHNEGMRKKLADMMLRAGADANMIDKDGNAALMIAIKNEAYYQLDAIIENGADPKVGNDLKNQNVFHYLALKCTNTDLTGYLLKLNQKMGSSNSSLINQVDYDGFTPLLLACETYAAGANSEDGILNGTKFIQELVENCGADVSVTVSKKAFLDKSNKHRSVPAFGLVIEKEKKVQNDPFVITGQFNCLHFFAMVKPTEEASMIIRMLVRSDAEKMQGLLNTRCRHGRSPLHTAIHFRNRFAACHLIDAGANVNLLSDNKKEDGLQTPLCMAARPSFQLEIVKKLLASKADPVIKDGLEFRTPLSYAVTNASISASHGSGTLDLLQSILKADPDIDSRDKNQRTALHHLINTVRGDYEALTDAEQCLLEHGANPCALDAFKRMPIHYAFAKIGKEQDKSMIDPISVVSLLCDTVKEQNRDLKQMLNQCDDQGRSPLHYAALRGASITCLQMLQYGAEHNIMDKDGNFPISLALRSGHHGCAMIFLQAGSTASCDVITPVTKDQLKKYEQALEKSKWEYKDSVTKPEAICKSAFHVAIQNNWQGVAYLMLEMAKLPLIDAFKAALKASKLQLLWTLMKKQRNPKSFSVVDSKGCNLLHLLAAHANSDMSNDGILIQIARLLLENGVNPGACDEDRITPLHLAAHHAHFGLCKLILSADKASLDVANKDGMTPLAAVFESAVNSGSIDKKHVKVIKYFINIGVKTVDVSFYTGTKTNNGEDESTTIMNDLVLLRNCGNFAKDLKKDRIGSIEYLLSKGADVNFTDFNKQNPLMTAINTNYFDMAELLLNDPKINLDATDKHGNSLIHYCVFGGGEYGSYENVKMFKLLRDQGAKLDLCDVNGHPPIYYAMLQKSGTLANLFPKKLKKRFDVTTLPSTPSFSMTARDLYWKYGEMDVSEDAKNELKKLVDITERDPVPPVGVKMGNHGVVYADSETGRYYDVVLNKVKSYLGVYAVNVFYKLQVIYHKGKQLWILFNSWGRVGSIGQHQQTPFPTPEEACKEFKKIFKSKTGNKWENLESFKHQPAKYALVVNEKNPERMLHRQKEILEPLDTTKAPDSSLPEHLQDFLREITDLKLFTTFLQENRLLDSRYMPFGLISIDVLRDAKVVLQDIKKLLDKLEEGNHSEQENIDTHEQITELSNRYFMMVPPVDYEYERVEPINRLDSIKEHMEQLDLLTDLSASSELLLAAQHRKHEINPLDYCYKALGCHLEMMDNTSDECKLILKFFENSRGSVQPEITGIYRVSRPNEEANFDKCQVKHNRRLLWHGTKSAHMAGILKHGLQLDARDVFRTGSMLGKGIYFSMSFNKAFSYCDLQSGRAGFMLLCEVALGDMKELSAREMQQDDEENQAESYNSIWQKSSKIPNPESDIITPDGVKVQAGEWITNPDYDSESNWYYDADHQCLVKDVNQIKIRYILILSE